MGRKSKNTFRFYLRNRFFGIIALWALVLSLLFDVNEYIFAFMILLWFVIILLLFCYVENASDKNAEERLFIIKLEKFLDKV